jgi:hypothetical protein
MKRCILMMLSVTAMLGAAMPLCGVAQAAPTVGTKADAKCLAEAVRTLGPGFHPADYTFHGGTEGSDSLGGQATAGPDVFCGFGGDDAIGSFDTLDEGDIFLGGPGNDVVDANYATFYGGAGDDRVLTNFSGATFFGGAGDDVVQTDLGGTFVQD